MFIQCFLLLWKKEKYTWRHTQKLNISESITTPSITVCYGNSDSSTKKKFDRVVVKASPSIQCDIPPVHYKHCVHLATAVIINDSSCLHHLFKLLPPGRHYEFIQNWKHKFQKDLLPFTKQTLMQFKMYLNNCLFVCLSERIDTDCYDYQKSY